MLKINQLIGFGVSGQRGSEIFVVSNALTFSSSNDVVLPGDVLAGDIAFIIDFAENADMESPSPTGWSTVETVGQQSMRMSIFRKILLSGDIGATVHAYDYGSTSRVAFLLVFRTATTWPGIIAFSDAVSITGDPAAITVPAGGQNTTAVVIAAYGVRNADPEDRTFVPTEDYDSGIETDANIRAAIKYKIFNDISTLEDVIIDDDDESPNQNNIIAGVLQTT